ncbi:MAG: glycosyltransferase family 4 protein [Candidatus Moranbacteria bacterium]|nr:glycosyltransferase family 4 protein [Candidatus Moranbacteria bacterium]
MKIGIDGSRAFLKQRTGIEEYSYRTIRHLAGKLNDHQVILYLRSKQMPDFELPSNWRMKKIRFSRFWTQIGLSLELMLHPVDALFVPAHTVPIIHPENTVVTIHGLEFEVMPEAYSPWERFYMRMSIKKSCQWAKKIISVSRSTRKDLTNIYEVPKEKISVIYEGYEEKSEVNPPVGGKKSKDDKNDPYLLFIGRIEKRKNIEGMIRAFEILKSKHGIPHRLVLIGRPGHGYEDIKKQIEKSEFKAEIVETGFVNAEKKQELLEGASVFLFPTFYEGFGLPILEAQNAGVPVVSSNVSSLTEVAEGSALLVDPREPEFIAGAALSLITDEKLANEMIQKGKENIKRFSWEKCAGLIKKIIED